MAGRSLRASIERGLRSFPEVQSTAEFSLMLSRHGDRDEGPAQERGDQKRIEEVLTHVSATNPKRRSPPRRGDGSAQVLVVEQLRARRRGEGSGKDTPEHERAAAKCIWEHFIPPNGGHRDAAGGEV